MGQLPCPWLWALLFYLFGNWDIHGCYTSGGLKWACALELACTLAMVLRKTWHGPRERGWGRGEGLLWAICRHAARSQVPPTGPQALGANTVITTNWYLWVLYSGSWMRHPHSSDLEPPGFLKGRKWTNRCLTNREWVNAHKGEVSDTLRVRSWENSLTALKTQHK